MLKIVMATQYGLCGISMVLTGMFSASIANASLEPFRDGEDSIYQIALLFLFVIIGLCVDTGKYLFWFHRNKGWFYGVNSILLALFSLLASLVFFQEANENLRISTIRDSRQYQAILEEIQKFEDEKLRQTKLLQQRLASRYHEQWLAAEEGFKYVEELDDRIRALKNKSENMLVNSNLVSMDSYEQDVIRGFSWSLIDAEHFRKICAVIFGILIEISSLSAISLTKDLRYRCYEHSEKKLIRRQVKKALQCDSVERLKADIRRGRVKPSIRAIRKAKYGIGTENIQKTLRSLLEHGVLEAGPRNGYVLVKDK